MSDQIELLIVIINYKTAALVIDCLKTVRPQLGFDHKVVVVDNFSDDGSAEAISTWLDENPTDQIELILSDTNSGFSGGNNLGIQTQNAKYYLLLNSDTLLRPSALEVLLSTANNNPKAGIVSPRLEWPDERPQISCFNYHSPISEFIDAACTGPFTKLFKPWDVPIEVEDGLSKPKWTSFACVLLRAEVIEQIGLMDEGYFLYYEDVDYCKMMANKGWEIINNPKARVVHLRGGSSDVKSNIKKKARLPQYYYASRTRFFRKHYGFLGHIAANVMWFFGRCISVVREVLGRNESPVCAQQWRDIWVNTFAPLKPYKR